MTKTADTSILARLAKEAGCDPVKDRLRRHIQLTIEALFEWGPAALKGCGRRGPGGALTMGHCNGHRDRQIVGPFGSETVSVPRARIVNEKGKITEWRSKARPYYQRLTQQAEAPFASVYLAGETRGGNRSTLTSPPDQAQILILTDRRQRIFTTFVTQPSPHAPDTRRNPRSDG